MFDTKYYDDAIGQMEIRQYSYPLIPSPNRPDSKEYAETQKTPGTTASQATEKYQLQNVIVLYEAYPVTVNEVQMSWGDEGYGKLMVEMRYHYYTEERRTPSNNGAFERDRAGRTVQEAIAGNPPDLSQFDWRGIGGI